MNNLEALEKRMEQRKNKTQKATPISSPKPTIQILKSYEQKSWEKWLESNNGKECSRGKAEGDYLENRLWWAFDAGFEAGKNSNY